MDGVTELVDVNDPNKNADDTNDLAKQLSKLIDLDGKRSLLFLFGGIQHSLVNLAQFCVHTRMSLEGGKKGCERTTTQRAEPPVTVVEE